MSKQRRKAPPRDKKQTVSQAKLEPTPVKGNNFTQENRWESKKKVHFHDSKISGNALERLYGHHAVKAVLYHRPKAVLKLYLAGQEHYHKDLIALAQRHKIDIFLVPWPDFLKLGQLQETDKHQGVLAYVKSRPIYETRDMDRLSQARCVVMLDQVSNPQNLATIIRSSAFFRADAICLMKHRAAKLTPEVVSFSVGGAELVEFYQITNVVNSINKLKSLGFTVVGLDGTGTRPLSACDMNMRLVFVIGAEGEGLRQRTRQYCDELLHIPGGRKGLESLNAGVASTIALYEWQRLK